MLLLTGDIGGTKTILRLVKVGADRKSFETIIENKYLSGDFPDLVPIVQQFLSASPQTNNITSACFAIAGPVVNKTSNLTNLDWQVDSNRLEAELNISHVSLINDFAANSYGVLGLESSEIYTLQAGKKIDNAPIAVIGAGTGLGQGFLIPQDDKYQVFASEGGHTDFAPRNDLEIQLLQYLQTKISSDHISVERVVSGQGIVSIYQFLRDSNFSNESSIIGQKISNWEKKIETNIDPAAVIAQGAIEQNDSICTKTMSLFMELYGAETGNLALKILPYGGIYIAGGVAAKNLSLIKKKEFINNFIQKGRMTKLLQDIPIHVVLTPELGVKGSILYALRNYN
ncbi:MAG: glucokinase [Xenococcaceae cyanobacterium MO_188.B19]|nr:glucokinase [Xenococcaceae cyanobacterium MO_188.B19]